MPVNSVPRHEADQEAEHREPVPGDDEQRRDDAADHEHDRRGGHQTGAWST